jgi:hypothetical protein
VGLRAALGASGRTDLWLRPWAVMEEGHGGGRRLFVALLLGIRRPGRSRSAWAGDAAAATPGCLHVALR